MTGMNAHAGSQAGPDAEPGSQTQAESQAGPRRQARWHAEPGSEAGSNPGPASEAGRARYHHGDLPNALTRAGVALARAGGPDAVVLREAARQVGVSPAAAYRHFAGHDDLRYAVKVQAQQELADAMEERLKESEPGSDPAAEAVRRMIAIGFAYLHFALEEPGLFRTAFCHAEPAQEPESGDSVHAQTDAQERSPVAAPTPDGAPAEVSELRRYRPFQILSENLDRLVELGVLPAARRPYAEIPAWAMVPGLATLLLDGPLDLGDKETQDAVLGMALNTLINGFVN